MFSDRLMVVHNFKLRPLALERIDVEMIRPELDHSLLKLTAAVHCPEDRGLAQSGDQTLIVFVKQKPRVGVQTVRQTAQPPCQDRFLSQQIRG